MRSTTPLNIRVFVDSKSFQLQQKLAQIVEIDYAFCSNWKKINKLDISIVMLIR